MGGGNMIDSCDPEEPVFVIDLTDEAMAECERDVAAAAEEDAPRGPERPLPAPPEGGEAITRVALLLEGEEAPLLLPVEPTRDMILLDALARLLRVAVLAGERVPSVAIEHGDALERRLAFERRLPRWVYEGLPSHLERRLPPKIRRVLSR
jgi:hypothetical protein